MPFEIDYAEQFSVIELKKLKSFENIILEEWVKNSNSTSSLFWDIEIRSEEPRLFAILKVKSKTKQLHVEACTSIVNKTNESFRIEFIKAAINYS